MLVPEFPKLADFSVEMTLELRDDEVEHIKAELAEQPAEAHRFAKESEPRVGLPKEIYGALLTDHSMKNHPALSDFVRAQISKGYDFLLLRVAISLRPAPRTMLPSVLVDVTLGTYNDMQPSVYWVLPFNVHQHRTRESEAQIKPDLKIGSEGVAVSLGHWVQREKVAGQDLKIVGYFDSSSATWTLESQDGEGISGSWELWLVAQWPRGLESVPVEMAVSASVHSGRGLFFTKPSVYRYDKVYREIS
jgi:hypothetical protein